MERIGKRYRREMWQGPLWWSSWKCKCYDPILQLFLKCYTQLDDVQKPIYSFSELLILKYVNLWFSKSDSDSAQLGAKHLGSCVIDWHEFGAAIVTWTVAVSQKQNPKIINEA